MSNVKKVAKTATAAPAASAKPNKFQQILASTGQEVLDQRATVMANKTVQAMQNKLTDLRGRRDDLTLAKLNLTDLSVESKDSLRPGNANFKPKEWIEQLCDLEMQLEELADEIAVAERIAEDFFGIASESAE